MFKKYLLFSPLTTARHCHCISAAAGLMCALSLDTQALERPIKLKVQITAHQSITPETTPIPFVNAGEDDLPLGEPEPIIVGTALIELSERRPAYPIPLGEPEPIIVGKALLAFYQTAPVDSAPPGPEPLGEPEPIIVGTVLMALDEQGQTDEDVLDKGGSAQGVALFEPAADVGGSVIVDGRKLGIRPLWRCGDFWTDRDFMIILVSTHPRHAATSGAPPSRTSPSPPAPGSAPRQGQARGVG